MVVERFQTIKHSNSESRKLKFKPKTSCFLLKKEMISDLFCGSDQQHEESDDNQDYA